MRKISISIVLSAGVLAALCFGLAVNSQADDNAVVQNGQVIKDEGYGKSDAEYYNSEDDVVNVDDPSGSQENSSNSSTVNNAQK